MFKMKAIFMQHIPIEWVINFLVTLIVYKYISPTKTYKDLLVVLELKRRYVIEKKTPRHVFAVYISMVGK